MKKQYNQSKLSRWWLRLTTFCVAALAGASATVWVLKLSAPVPPVLTTASTPPGLTPTDEQTWVRLLDANKAGAQALPAAGVAADISSTRFKLQGVVAGRGNQGYALIAADGKAAKPYRVGDQVEEGLVLKSVAPRSAELARALDVPTGLTLQLPKLAP